jgi:hypothetical protein
MEAVKLNQMAETAAWPRANIHALRISDCPGLLPVGTGRGQLVLAG